MSEGMIYQRGPNGEVPKGQSINGQDGTYGTLGAGDHVTMHGDGWHRSWDNDPVRGNHSTDHATRRIRQHPSS